MIPILVFLQLMAVVGDQAPGQPTGNQALVVRIEGDASLERPGHEARSLRIGDLLEQGDRVRADPEGRVLLFLRDGRISTVTTELDIPVAPGEESPSFARTRDMLLRFAERPPPAAPEVPEEPKLPRPIQPANGIPVRVLNPTLHWLPEPGSVRHRVHVWGGDAEVRSFEVEGDTFAIVPPEWALTPGERYEWTVETVPEGEPAPRMRFRVLDREGMDRVANGLRELRDVGLDPETSGALPAAALFLEMDLIYDALMALDSILHVEDGTLHPALGSLRSYLRLYLYPIPVSGLGTPEVSKSLASAARL